MRGDSPVRHKEYTSKNALHEVLLRARYNRTTYIWGLLEQGKHIRCPKSRQAITGNQSVSFYYLTVMQRWTVCCKKLHVS